MVTQCTHMNVTNKRLVGFTGLHKDGQDLTGVQLVLRKGLDSDALEQELKNLGDTAKLLGEGGLVAGRANKLNVRHNIVRHLCRLRVLQARHTLMSTRFSKMERVWYTPRASSSDSFFMRDRLSTSSCSPSSLAIASISTIASSSASSTVSGSVSSSNNLMTAMLMSVFWCVSKRNSDLTAPSFTCMATVVVAREGQVGCGNRHAQRARRRSKQTTDCRHVYVP